MVKYDDQQTQEYNNINGLDVNRLQMTGQGYSSNTFSQPQSMLIKSQFQTGYNSRGVESREDNDQLIDPHSQSDQYVETDSEADNSQYKDASLMNSKEQYDDEEEVSEAEMLDQV